VAKPVDILPKLMQAYVDASTYAERMSKESFNDIRPDYSELKKIFEEDVPIKHRRDYVWFLNDLTGLIQDSLCKHPQDKITGDKEPGNHAKQTCTVCGLHRYATWNKTSDDGGWMDEPMGDWVWMSWYD
jgi:hypothetical protein